MINHETEDNPQLFYNPNWMRTEEEIGIFCAYVPNPQIMLNWKTFKPYLESRFLSLIYLCLEEENKDPSSCFFSYDIKYEFPDGRIEIPEISDLPPIELLKYLTGSVNYLHAEADIKENIQNKGLNVETISSEEAKNMFDLHNSFEKVLSLLSNY